MSLILSKLDQNYFDEQDENKNSGCQMSVQIKPLPNELLMHILSYLPATDLLNCSKVNRQFHALAKDHTLWKNEIEALKQYTPDPNWDETLSPIENIKANIQRKVKYCGVHPLAEWQMKDIKPAYIVNRIFQVEIIKRWRFNIELSTRDGKCSLTLSEKYSKDSISCFVSALKTSQLLNSLEINFNIPSELVSLFAESMANPEEVYLSQKSKDDQTSVQPWTNKNINNIKSLKLTGLRIGDAEIQEISKILNEHPALEKLEIGCLQPLTEIGRNALRSLLLSLNHLTELRIQGNVKEISKSLQFVNLIKCSGLRTFHFNEKRIMLIDDPDEREGYTLRQISRSV